MTRLPSSFLPGRGALALALAGALVAGGCTGQVGAVANPPPGSAGTGNVGGSGNAMGTAGATGTGSISGATGGAGSGSVSGGGGALVGAGGSGGTASTADLTTAGLRPLRLLTRREYLNTIRDLLSDTTILPGGLPAEDEDPLSGFAFHTTGTVATLDATLYRDAAEALAKNAVTHLTTLLPCASAATTTATENTCLGTFMTTLGMKMARRPLAAAEVTRLTSLFQTGRTTLALNFSAAVGLVIEAVLQSPEFLYHWEVDPGAAIKEGAVVKLGNYEVSNRLSYFLWGTMPDATLFTAAAAAQLGDAASVEAQVRRMLKDAKAGGAIADFFADWLDIDTLVDKPKDPTVYPMYNDALTSAMGGEVQSFVNAIVVNGTGRFDELMTGTNSFANQALAALYGITGVTGTALKAVSLNPAQRSGLLTMAGFMSLTGGAAGSEPPRRGKAVFNKLLCGTLPPPPAVVPDPKPVSAGVTTRQRFEEHAANPCATACHALIDPLGFAFENYDGIGQYRSTDNNLPVNAATTVSLDGQPHMVADARGLAAALAASDQVQTCFTKQWFRYALGRADTAADLASINAAGTAFKAATRDVRELVVGLATSRTFRYRMPAAGEVLP